MGTSDLSTGLGFGILAPSAISEVEGNSSHPDGEDPARRRRPPEQPGPEENPAQDQEQNQQNQGQENALSETSDQPAHQLDRLA